MTKERAIEIVNIAIPNTEDLETRIKIVSQFPEHGISHHALFVLLAFAGVDMSREDVFNAMFLEDFKKFVAEYDSIPTAP